MEARITAHQCRAESRGLSVCVEPLSGEANELDRYVAGEQFQEHCSRRGAPTTCTSLACASSEVRGPRGRSRGGRVRQKSLLSAFRSPRSTVCTSRAVIAKSPATATRLSEPANGFHVASPIVTCLISSAHRSLEESLFRARCWASHELLALGKIKLDFPQCLIRGTPSSNSPIGSAISR